MELSSSSTHSLRNIEEHRVAQTMYNPTSSKSEDDWDRSFPFSIPAGKVLEIQTHPHAINPNTQPWRGVGRDGRRRVSPPSSTLYVGDLPMLCDEMKLFNLFHSFGEIEAIQFKKNSSDLQTNRLSYGFIRFASHESAVRALEEVNGLPFYGRNLRLGWAEDRDRGSHHFQRNQTVEVVPKKKSFPPTAQIHVSFVSKNMAEQITEIDLRHIFHQFGNMVDVEVKKSDFNQGSAVQSGYGFVRFALTEEGIQSALTAIDFVNGKVIDGTTFQCTATHALKTHLLSMRPRPFPQQAVGLPDKPALFSGPFSQKQGKRPKKNLASHPRPLIHDGSARTMPSSTEISIPGLHDSALSRMSGSTTPSIYSPPISSVNPNSTTLLNERHLPSNYPKFGLF